MNDRSESRQSSAATPLNSIRQTAQSDLQYVSLQIDGKTYGGWYRVLGDGRLELLALSHVHREPRSDSAPIEQAKGMLADLVHASGFDLSGRYPSHATSEAGDDRTDCIPSTLGDLLYADRSKTRVAEAGWEVLVRSMAAGDREGLHRLFDRTQHIVFTLMFRRVDDPEVAEELTLDVFQEVWRRAVQFDPARGTVLAWLMNIARLAADAWIESSRSRKDLSAGASAHERTRPDFRAEAKRFRAALAALAQHERESLERAYFSPRPAIPSTPATSANLSTVDIHSSLTKLRYALSSGQLR